MSMSNLVQLKTPIDDDLIETMDTLLERCRSGEVLALSVAVVLKDRTYSTAWAGDFDTAKMVGILAYLQKRLLDERLADV